MFISDFNEIFSWIRCTEEELHGRTPQTGLWRHIHGQYPRKRIHSCYGYDKKMLVTTHQALSPVHHSQKQNHQNQQQKMATNWSVMCNNFIRLTESHLCHLPQTHHHLVEKNALINLLS